MMTNKLKTVILWHKKTDQKPHYDWMLAQDKDEKLPLVSFRVEKPLHRLNKPSKIIVERIQDHRPYYLNFNGSHNKRLGEIKHVENGDYTFVEKKNNLWKLLIFWDSDKICTVKINPTKTNSYLEVTPMNI